MSIYLVRHAKAGSRSQWEGDDTLRPLSKRGRQQADAVGQRLRKLGGGSLIASPYARCVQTLEPLAHRRGVVINTDERLAEDSGFDGAIELLASVPDGSVLCSHGDVIPATIEALQRRGCEITTPPDWRKASVWVLDRNEHGQVVSAACWPPPDEG